jgi:hypothetical protein
MASPQPGERLKGKGGPFVAFVLSLTCLGAMAGGLFGALLMGGHSNEWTALGDVVNGLIIGLIIGGVLSLCLGIVIGQRLSREVLWVVATLATLLILGALGVMS